MKFVTKIPLLQVLLWKVEIGDLFGHVHVQGYLVIPDEWKLKILYFFEKTEVGKNDIGD